METEIFSKIELGPNSYQPMARSGHSANLYNGKMYIFGGIFERLPNLKVAFAHGELAPAISSLLSLKEIKGCVIFSTCNRSEIYVSHDSKNIRDVLIKFLASSHGIDYHSLIEYVSYYEENEAVQHICNVACGLESLVLGEPQIFGQLKDAYQLSKNESALDKILEKLFQHVFKIAKKVRTDTNIGSSPVSVAYCAVKLSEKIFTNLSSQTVLLIGAGTMIELSAQHLSKRGVRKMIFANRTIRFIFYFKIEF